MTEGTTILDEIVRRELVNGYLKYSNQNSTNNTNNTYNITNSSTSYAGNNAKLFGGGGGGSGGGKKRRKGLISSGAFMKNGDLPAAKNVTATFNRKRREGSIITTTASNNNNYYYSSISVKRNKTNSSEEQKVLLPPQQLPLLARSTRTTSGGGSESSRSSISSTTGTKEKSSPSSSSFGLMMMSAPEGSADLFGTGSSSSAELVGDGGMRSSSSISSSSILNNNANDHLFGGGSGIGGGGGDVVGARRILDIHQISSRLHRSFQWEGQSSTHTIAFSSFYIVPLILLLGFLVACVWLFCACCYHTMKKIKFSSFCPGRSRSKKNKSDSSNNYDDRKKEILTPELLEMRRQERLAFLQAECANLEQQLTGLRAQQNEKSCTLTSRASDSDLEYLGASESPPLKRNSISLQDIPQSVIRIRREKELRQIKEEIEYLRTIAQQEKEKSAEIAKGILKGTLLTHDFELPGSKPSSPGETKVEPLSQHISHLKAQRKLNEIRSELEDLAMQVLHADEIKAKRSSLQDLPRTALNIQREQNLISMNNEIQKIKNYKLQKRNVIETALEKCPNPKGNPSGKNKGGAAGNPNKPGGSGSAVGDKKASGSKSFNNSINEGPSTQDTAAKYSDPEFVHRASIRRQREQELNRVRVELKDLAYKLNLNPMNYISEDRVRLVPSQSMQSTSSASGGAGQSSKTFSSTSGLNHV